MKSNKFYVYGIIFVLVGSLASCVGQNPSQDTVCDRDCRTDVILEQLEITQQSEKMYCAAVVDGDTIKLENGESVRLIGIDAPELSEPGGDIARDYLVCLVLYKDVTLVRGHELKDDYGRLLRYVYVNGLCVNEAMIKNGYAEARYITDSMGDYIELEKEAEKKGLALWKCGVFQPRSAIAWSSIPVIDWKDAEEHLGEYVIVEGVIVSTYNSGTACFLHFHSEWKSHFTAVIFAGDFLEFPEPPEMYYLGKKVQIVGVVQVYKGSPEIIVKTPDQIRIIG